MEISLSNKQLAEILLSSCVFIPHLTGDNVFAIQIVPIVSNERFACTNRLALVLNDLGIEMTSETGKVFSKENNLTNLLSLNVDVASFRALQKAAGIEPERDWRDRP